MILDKQTNKVYISDKIRTRFPEVSKRLTDAMDKEGVSWGSLQYTNDIWCRDYMPIQVAENRFIQYCYYPDYLDTEEDKHLRTDPTETLAELGIETIKTDIIIDGGNVIKCDDCVIMVDKVFKENPNYTQSALVNKLETLFCSEIIFLPWDHNEKYGHADGIVRYVSKGKVLMTNYHDFDTRFFDKFLSVLSKKFDVSVLKYRGEIDKRYNWAYINFLQTEHSIFVPVFDRKEDEQALEQIATCYPDYKDHIIPVKFNSVVQQGGAINCVTWNIKK